MLVLHGALDRPTEACAIIESLLEQCAIIQLLLPGVVIPRDSFRWEEVWVLTLAPLSTVHALL